MKLKFPKMKKLNLVLIAIIIVTSHCNLRSQGKAINTNLSNSAKQNSTFLAEWGDHLPYHHAISVATADDLVYCTTEYGLFYYDKTSNQTSRLSKVNGLSDIGVSCISWSEEYQMLIIAYSNCNIDLIKNNSIVNIPEIKQMSIFGSKTINNITIVDSLAYLACGFGIVVLDFVKEEFPYPVLFIGNNSSQVNVQDITMGMDTIFAATESGIYKAPIDSPNLPHFSSWSIDQRLKPEAFFNVIQYFNNSLLVNVKGWGYQHDTTYLYNFMTHSWDYFPEMDHYSKVNFKENNNRLIVVSKESVKVLDNTLALLQDINFLSSDLSPRDADYDKDDTLWIADYDLGLVKALDDLTGLFIAINGPYSQSVFDMSMEGENLWVAAGGHTGDWKKLYNNDGVYSYVNGSWNTFNKYNGFQVFDSISDMICVEVDPINNKHVFVGTWQCGVIEFLDNQVINVYGDNNSSLQKWPEENIVAISGLDYDAYNNLWVANSGASRMISVKEINGNWTSFSLGAGVSSKDVGEIIIDSYNQKWLVTRENHSLFVFSENGTISNSNDDQTKVLTSEPGNGNLPGTRIYSFAQDHDGKLWIGSDDGVGVISYPDSVFKGGRYDAWRPLINLGGYTEYLLQARTVTAISIDIDNRKWMGTKENGVFLFSVDGSNEILHFTEENSPLFSNSIIDIEINSMNGVIFIATDNGIISYKNAHSIINNPFDRKDYLNVRIFPNPLCNKATIEFSNPDRSNYKLLIFSINGCMVFKKEDIKSDKVEFERGILPDGVYLIELNGEKVFRGKMIIK